MGSSGYIVRVEGGLSSVAVVLRGFAAVIDRRAERDGDKAQQQERQRAGKEPDVSAMQCVKAADQTERRERNTRRSPKTRRDVSRASTPDALFHGAR